MEERKRHFGWRSRRELFPDVFIESCAERRDDVEVDWKRRRSTNGVIMTRPTMKNFSITDSSVSKNYQAMLSVCHLQSCLFVLLLLFIFYFSHQTLLAEASVRKKRTERLWKERPHPDESLPSNYFFSSWGCHWE